MDKGISGWKSEQRHAFQKLIADAEKGGEFEAVLCWDQDRFSRFPVLEANHYWFLLDRAGVHIATVAQGRLRFDKLGEWLQASITQYGKEQYVRDLARNTTRGLRKRKLAGRWIGAVPHGYRLGDDGFLKLGDPAEIAVVRKVFKMRSQGYGYRAIAKHLNEKGIKPPRAKLWSQRAVKHFLQRDAYVGNIVIGKHSHAKFERLTPEETTIKNTHPAIVKQDVWDECQSMGKKQRKSYGHRNSEGAPLTGLLFCGRCNGPMYAHQHRRRTYYICGSYHAYGTCNSCRVPQDAAHRAIASKIRDKVLMGSLDRLEAAVAKQIEKQASEAVSVDKAALRRSITTVDRKIHKATDRLVSVADSLVPMLEAKLLELQEERQHLESELEAANPKRHILDARKVAQRIWQLDEVMRKGSPTVVRHALSKIINRVTLNFKKGERTQRGQRIHFVGGRIELHTNGVQFSGRRSPSHPGSTPRSW